MRRYHERQPLQSWHYEEDGEALRGTLLGRRSRGSVSTCLTSYPSSVLMNAIPAKVAGVQELIMVVPTPGGERNPLVLAAAALAGVDRVFCIGGAQAIGALAYGTESVPKVDKIVGPGNAFVAEAKRQVFGQVAIDMIRRTQRNTRRCGRNGNARVRRGGFAQSSGARRALVRSANYRQHGSGATGQRGGGKTAKNAPARSGCARVPSKPTVRSS